MDYKRIYDDLMQSRLLMKGDRIKLRKMGDYFERHHILPKSMGGGGKLNINHTNLILLTGREHYIAHALLFLIYRNREMTYAFRVMCNGNNSKNRNYLVSARMYEFLKIEINRLGKSVETREKIRKANLGRKHSPEAREKMREAHLGKKHSPEAKEKVRQAQLGRKRSSEHVEKIRQANLGKKISIEHIEKLRQANLGRKRSSEHVEKIRQANLGRTFSPESRERMREAQLGKKHSPERVERMRQTNLGRKMSPEAKEKIRQANLGRKMSPEAKEKIRQFQLSRKDRKGVKHSPESIKKREETKKRNRLLKLAQMEGQDGLQKDIR